MAKVAHSSCYDSEQCSSSVQAQQQPTTHAQEVNHTYILLHHCTGVNTHEADIRCPGSTGRLCCPYSPPSHTTKVHIRIAVFHTSIYFLWAPCAHQVLQRRIARPLIPWRVGAVPLAPRRPIPRLIPSRPTFHARTPASCMYTTGLPKLPTICRVHRTCAC